MKLIDLKENKPITILLVLIIGIVGTILFRACKVKAETPSKCNEEQHTIQITDCHPMTQVVVASVDDPAEGPQFQETEWGCRCLVVINGMEHVTTSPFHSKICVAWEAQEQLEKLRKELEEKTKDEQINHTL